MIEFANVSPLCRSEVAVYHEQLSLACRHGLVPTPRATASGLPARGEGPLFLFLGDRTFFERDGFQGHPNWVTNINAQGFAWGLSDPDGRAYVAGPHWLFTLYQDTPQGRLLPVAQISAAELDALDLVAPETAI